MNQAGLYKWLAILFLVLLVNTAYIAAFSSATVFYMGNVLLHLMLGLVLALLVLFTIRHTRSLLTGAPLAMLLFFIALVFGALLSWRGNVYANRWMLWAHIASAGLGVIALVPFVTKQASAEFRRGFAVALILLVALPAAAVGYRKAFPDTHDRIANPPTAPVSMDGEGGGPQSPFFPSSARTNVGGIIPSNFFMDSKTCGECHKKIYEEWKSSVHHFGSFNNQFYRKAIENMQETQGTTHGSKWCAGCHDHAVFFNGRFDKPIKDQIDTPEAQVGLACTSCHAIVHVDSTMGNGDFTIEYPALHQLMTSKNPIVKASVDFMTYLDPEPHRKTFLKPFMTMQSSQFCSACHKVHLDVPVNNYRWFRGFNDYDNWQASGFGDGARSFYYPPKSVTCAGCHMPLEPSAELGSKGGEGHSHRFAAANTSVSHANLDAVQTAAEQKFLTSGFITVDIFAASPVSPSKKSGDIAGKRQESAAQQSTPAVSPDFSARPDLLVRRATGPTINSGIATGEEAEQTGDTFIREVGQIAAPLDIAKPKLVPGSTARVDVVVRTRKIGHFFPGGTLDSFDIWLELEAKDAAGKVIYWNGRVGGDGKIDPGAHMYKAFQLDGDGNEINKRNAYQARSVLYVHAIPPGAADTVHYLMRIPKDAQGPITITAKLNHRKFSWYYTHFAYAGQPKPGQNPSLNNINYNSFEYSFDKSNIPANVSGAIKHDIPMAPITVLASANATLDLASGSAQTTWTPVAAKNTRERWNDWGIGLLLQGDVKGAEYAFTKVTEAEPGYADGWLNVARALIQEGETERAKPYIAKAMQIDSSLGRIWYFKALIEKADGDYDGALRSLKVVTDKYPRDRVVWNQVGRLLFLKRQYQQSIEALKKVAAIDPEDLQMHYTAMLSYRGLGDTQNAAREQKLFQRFKAEESAQSITAKRRLISPEDNNERQAIHDHETMSLTPDHRAPSEKPYRAATVRERKREGL